MDKKRRELIEESLHKDLFKIADDIVVEEDPNDFSSTEKLANILDGYITKVENLQFDDETDDIEVLDFKNLEIEVDEKDIVKAYSDHIHEFDEDTFDKLLNSQETKTLENIEIELVDELDKLDENDEFDSETEHTQTIVSPKEITQLDDMKFDEQESDNEDDSKFEILDFVLIFAVIVLVVVLIYIVMKG